MMTVTGDKVVVIKTGRTGVVASISERSGTGWSWMIRGARRRTTSSGRTLGLSGRKRGPEKPSPDIVEGARVIIENDAPSQS